MRPVEKERPIMIYKTFQDLKLSSIGMGCMRLPVIDGNDAKIDVSAVDEMIDYAMGHGVNYYDTAWGYHGGQSEIVVGASLARYPRENYYVASKFPGYDVSNFGKVEEIFNRQLEKTGFGYFDFYLIHNVCELNIEQYLDDETYHTVSFLLEQKERGLIKHLGFSAHGDVDTIARFLEAYGEHMEFGQLQLNYFDWKFQHSNEKVALLTEYGIPVWSMEPMRGGHLVSFTDSQMERLQAARPELSAADWALRYLQTLPEVTVTLTGASSLEQLAANIAAYEQEAPLTADQMALLYSIADEMAADMALPCTACRYCVSHCPQELDIPTLLALYNEHRSKSAAEGFIAPMALAVMPEDKRPSACIGCQSCEAVCPQQIEIAAALADFAEILPM